MPILKEQFDTFFRGGAAEMHVASLFYLAGYEASRVTPDSGVDLIVTNAARSKLLGETFISRRVQIKSSIVDAFGASIKISDDELNFLCDEPDCFTVIVLMQELRVERYLDSFSHSRDVVAEQIERAVDDHWEEEIGERGRTIGASKSLPPGFAGGTFRTFWLNGAQLTRLRQRGAWVQKDRSNVLKMQLIDGAVEINGLGIVPELFQIRHVMSTERHFGFESGKIHHEDIWDM